MTIGEIILAVINFLIHPTWHLVVLYVILLLLVAYSMLKEWGFTSK
jgi:hypothetical protein